MKPLNDICFTIKSCSSQKRRNVNVAKVMLSLHRITMYTKDDHDQIMTFAIFTELFTLCNIFL